jgi:hypothetical protein
VLRIIGSEDRQHWQTLALIRLAGHDLRDPHFCLLPDGRLMLYAGCVSAGEWSLTTVAAYSRDGANWTVPVPVGQGGNWIWRLAWSGSIGLGVGYSPRATPPFVTLYRTTDGREFETLVHPLRDQGYPNEAGLVFDSRHQAHCLLRRDGEGQFTALLGESEPPYDQWRWRDVGMPLGSPHLILGPEGAIIGAVRMYDENWKARVSLISFTEAGEVVETFSFPSSGDCGYPGMIWENQSRELWLSYYSGHEGKTKIYLAMLKPEATHH